MRRLIFLSFSGIVFNVALFALPCLEVRSSEAQELIKEAINAEEDLAEEEAKNVVTSGFSLLTGNTFVFIKSWIVCKKSKRLSC